MHLDADMARDRVPISSGRVIRFRELFLFCENFPGIFGEPRCRRVKCCFRAARLRGELWGRAGGYKNRHVGVAFGCCSVLF